MREIFEIKEGNEIPNYSNKKQKILHAFINFPILIVKVEFYDTIGDTTKNGMQKIVFSENIV